MLSAQGIPLTLSPSKGERNAFFNGLLTARGQVLNLALAATCAYRSPLRVRSGPGPEVSHRQPRSGWRWVAPISSLLLTIRL